MSYTNETTHYGIPLPLASDLTTPMDYNTSMQALDTAVFDAVTDATAGVQKANAVEEALGTTNDNLSALTGRVTSAEGTLTTQGNAITQLQLDVADTKADALDMVCAVDEGTAQVATVAVQEGKYFRYNDVLYMATADIAIGDTIVPNTNCRATNVATELEGLDSEGLVNRVDAIENVIPSDASASNKLATQADIPSVTSAVKYISDCTVFESAGITGSSTTSFTATHTGYASLYVTAGTSNPTTVTINGHNYMTFPAGGGGVCTVPVKVGDIVAIGNGHFGESSQVYY